MQCRSCTSKKIQAVLSLGNQYLSDFRRDDIRPPKYPLDLVLCQECFLVQLKETTPSQYLYTENYGYKSGINGTIRNDLLEIVERVRREVQLEENDIWIDQGSNDGTLLSYVPRYLLRVGVEPVKKLAKESEKYTNTVIAEFWSYPAYEKKMKGTKAKVITTISCFYDMDDPNTFVADTVKALATNGIWVIQQNYLVGMLKQNAYDNIVHEHLEYYSLLSLEHLLKKFGVEVYKVEQNSINGGSFRTYIQHRGCRPIDSSVGRMREEEKRLALDTLRPYISFSRRVKRISQELHTLVTRLVAKGKKIYVYAASTRGNCLLQYSGLNKRLIAAAVERNPEKWGRKIASLQIPIISEEEARKDPCDYGLLLPWFFAEEITKREQEFLDQGHHFIIPLPELKVI